MTLKKIVQKTYGELYDKTLETIELIKSAGYNIITMWGHNFIN